jgi:hypothetical protein
MFLNNITNMVSITIRAARNLVVFPNTGTRK